jgi:hypothetical protein
MSFKKIHRLRLIKPIGVFIIRGIGLIQSLVIHDWLHQSTPEGRLLKAESSH